MRGRLTIRNTSRFPTDEVRELVRFGMRDVDVRGGCVNVLTPRRPQVKNTDGMGSNSCLVEFEAWTMPSTEMKRA